MISVEFVTTIHNCRPNVKWIKLIITYKLHIISNWTFMKKLSMKRTKHIYLYINLVMHESHSIVFKMPAKSCINWNLNRIIEIEYHNVLKENPETTLWIQINNRLTVDYVHFSSSLTVNYCKKTSTNSCTETAIYDNVTQTKQ